jgi:hypothetical protein
MTALLTVWQKLKLVPIAYMHIDMWTWNGYDQDIFVHDSKWDTNAMQC